MWTNYRLGMSYLLLCTLYILSYEKITKILRIIPPLLKPINFCQPYASLAFIAPRDPWHPTTYCGGSMMLQRVTEVWVRLGQSPLSHFNATSLVRLTQSCDSGLRITSYTSVKLSGLIRPYLKSQNFKRRIT